MAIRIGFVAALFLFAFGCGSARAQENWYLGAVWLIHDRSEFQPIPGDGSIRQIWVRSLFTGHDFALNGDRDAGHPTMRSRYVFDCVQNRIQPVETQELDRSGDVVRTFSSTAAPLEPGVQTDSAWRRLLVSICEGAPTHWDRPPHPATGATTSNVLRALVDTAPARREWAQTQVQNEPGAFPPHVTLEMAAAMARAGQDDEALRWWIFSLVRAYTDAFAVHPGLDGASESELSALAAYTVRIDARILHRFRTFSEEQRGFLLERAADDDATIPRYYPVDWATWPAAQAINWTQPRNAPGTDFVFRGRLEPARADALRRATALAGQ